MQFNRVPYDLSIQHRSLVYIFIFTPHKNKFFFGEKNDERKTAFKKQFYKMLKIK